MQGIIEKIKKLLAMSCKINDMLGCFEQRRISKDEFLEGVK